MNMNEVYTELIMEHNNSGHNHRVLEDYSKEERGHNPSCGDDITLRVKIENGIIEDAAFSGVGCAISKASASMMIDLIRGKSTQEALDYVHKFFGMIKKEIVDDSELEVLEEAIALKNISNLPARTKCAVLAWHTLKESLK